MPNYTPCLCFRWHAGNPFTDRTWNRHESSTGIIHCDQTLFSDSNQSINNIEANCNDDQHSAYCFLKLFLHLDLIFVTNLNFWASWSVQTKLEFIFVLRNSSDIPTHRYLVVLNDIQVLIYSSPRLGEFFMMYIHFKPSNCFQNGMNVESSLNCID